MHDEIQSALDQPTPPVKPGKNPSKFRRWVAAHKILVIIIAVIILLAGGAVSAYVILNQKPAPVVETPKTVVVAEPAPEPVKYYSPLTGNLVDSEAATTQAVTGIMIENSPDARPQSGLADAGVVFEAIAEGGITRFLVIYQESKPQLIGPVRSVRMYYVQWAAAFNASIAHIGGSAAALAEVRNGNYRDIDQFFNSAAYWRATDRYAPHNVYTSFAKLDALNAAKGYTTSTFNGFTRADGAPSATPNATAVTVKVSSPLFNSSYIYDAATNSYMRSQAGAPHLDREKGQLHPSVVIAMRVDQTTVMEDGYRQDIKAVGSGAATIFQNGIATAATWTKSAKTSQIVFTDASGAIIPLVRGQTWITAVPNSGGNVSWQ